MSKEHINSEQPHDMFGNGEQLGYAPQGKNDVPTTSDEQGFEPTLDNAFRELFQQIGTGSARLSDLHQYILQAHREAVTAAEVALLKELKEHVVCRPSVVRGDESEYECVDIEHIDKMLKQ